EDARGIDHSPAIAGAYFAAKLGVVEYLSKMKIQAGVVILREIRSEYAIPVGVWQVREGIRATMNQNPTLVANFDDAILLASNRTSISKTEWLSHGNILKLMRQKTLSDFF
ncbi:MAG: hypothetical protein OEY17_08025, partial [Nitrosopumilus sp.]|nr:hypothetical protein [Nitrosopumilus sp.]